MKRFSVFVLVLWVAGLMGAVGVPTAPAPTVSNLGGLGTGVGTALGVNIGSAGAPVLFNGAGGTPSSITLTNGTGLPISTGLSGAGTGFLTAAGNAVNATGGLVTHGGDIGAATGTSLTLGTSGLVGGTNLIEQRNGTSGQRFNIYSTYTSGSNYADGFISMGLAGTDMWIGTQGAGASGSGGKLTFAPAASARWHMATNGQLLAVSGGTASDPALSFNSDPNTGLYSTNGDQLYIATGGSGRYKWTLTAMQMDPAAGLRWCPDNIDGNADCGMVRAGVGAIGVTAGATSSNGATLRFSANSPAQITSNQDNYTAGGSGAYKSYFQRWSTDAARDVTGLSISQVDGEVHVIVNVGAQNIVLKHDVTSTAANRFLCSTGADITLAANQAADLVYDGTTQRWRVFKRNSLWLLILPVGRRRRQSTYSLAA